MPRFIFRPASQRRLQRAPPPPRVTGTPAPLAGPSPIKAGVERDRCQPVTRLCDLCGTRVRSKPGKAVGGRRRKVPHVKESSSCTCAETCPRTRLPVTTRGDPGSVRDTRRHSSGTFRTPPAFVSLKRKRDTQSEERDSLLRRQATDRL